MIAFAFIWSQIKAALYTEENPNMNAVTKSEGGALALHDADLLNVLQSSLYPGAAMDSIRLVIGYCKAAGLDPMQKPVHIVPMWDPKTSRMRDVIMPGVNLYRTQAARSGQFAGISEPEFGPMVDAEIGGAKITYPEWARVTVEKLLPNGTVGKFTAREYWIENYAAKGGKEKSVAPNAMWTKRPRGQIAKCAQAQALRMAFPEIASQPTAEEMEGKTIAADEPEVVVVDLLTPEQVAEWQAAAEQGTEKSRAFWMNAGSDFRRRATEAQKNAMWSIAQDADRKRTVDDSPKKDEGVPDPEFVAALDAADGTAP